MLRGLKNVVDGKDALCNSGDHEEMISRVEHISEKQLEKIRILVGDLQ